MWGFIKRNKYGIIIGSGVFAALLAIIGLITGITLLFFVALVFFLPAICLLIYDAFFNAEKTDLTVQSQSKINTRPAQPQRTFEPTYDEQLYKARNDFATEEDIAREIAQLDKDEKIKEDIETMVAEAALLARRREYERELLAQNITPISQIKIEKKPEPEIEEFITPDPILTSPDPIPVVVETKPEPTPVPTVIPQIVPEQPIITEPDIAPEPTPEPEPEIEPEPAPATEPPEVPAQPVTVPEKFSNDYNDFPLDTNAKTEPTAAEEVAVEEPALILHPTPEVVSEPEIEQQQVAETEPQPKLNLAPYPVPDAMPEQSAGIDTPFNTAAADHTAEQLAKRKMKADEKKALLAKPNIEKYLKNYFIETAICFLLDRDDYIDRVGVAPYNKITIRPSEVPGEQDIVLYSMSPTYDKLYKFGTYLPDVERFITHEEIYHNFITLLENGTSLVQTTEKLYTLYRKFYKKDFILNLANREDFNNVVILVFNNYILDNDNFKDVFNRVPFDIPSAMTEENVVAYLSNPDLENRFVEKFPSYNELGIETVWEAMTICFFNSIKTKLSVEQLENAILKDTKRIAKALKRAHKQNMKRSA